jgi:hypothetical protein
MPHSRRHHYNPHDGSPHFGMLNILIGLAVMMCLWNVWTAPPPKSAINASVSSSMIRNYSCTYIERQKSCHDQQELQQQEDEARRLQLVRAIKPQSTTRTQISAPAEKIQNGIRLLPAHTGSDGQKFILLASKRGQETLNKAIVSSNELEKEGNILKMHSQPRRKSSIRKDEVYTNRRGLSTPLFVDMVTYETLPASSSSMYPRHHYQPNLSSWLFGTAVSGSILAGGLLAVRILIRMDRWEQLSKEDSLAFDVAYTSPYIDDGESYGSFASSEWSGDRLDRFDV